MEVAFSNTLRSLEAERFSLTLGTLVVAVLLLVAWDVWFLFGQVPRYETVPIIQVEQGGDIVVSVPATFLDHIAYGQPALLNLDGESRSVRATVVGVDIAKGQVRLWVDDENIFLPQKTKGQVEFAIAHTTPIAMLLRAAGLSGNLRSE